MAGVAKYIGGAGSAVEYYDPAAKRPSDYQRTLFNTNIQEGLELPGGKGVRVGQGSPVVNTSPAVTVGSPYPPNPNTLPAVRNAAGMPGPNTRARGFTLGAEGQTIGAGRAPITTALSTQNMNLVPVDTPSTRPVRAGVPQVSGLRGLSGVGVTRFGGGQLVDPGGGLVGHYARHPDEFKADINTVQGLAPSGSDPYETNISKIVDSGTNALGFKGTNSIFQTPGKYVGAAGRALAGAAGNLFGKFANDPNFFGGGGEAQASPVPTPAVAPAQTSAATTVDRAPIDWTKAAANAMKAVGGFGVSGNTYNMDGSARGAATTPEQDDASRLAAETAQTNIYKASAAQQDKAQGILDAANRTKALNDRVVELSKPVKMSGLDEYNMSYVGDAKASNPSYRNAMVQAKAYQEGIDARKAELASATGQQVLNDTNQNKLDQENVKGGFGLQDQELRNQGTISAETARGGFSVKAAQAAKELSPEDKALKTAQTKVLNEQPTKTELAAQAAENKKAEITLTQRKAIADARSKAYAEFLAAGDPDAASKADDVAMQAEAGLTGKKYTPGVAGQKSKFRFGFGQDEIKRTAGSLSRAPVDDPALQAELKKRGLI